MYAELVSLLRLGYMPILGNILRLGIQSCAFFFAHAWINPSAYNQDQKKIVGTGRIRTYVEIIQQIYNLSLLTTQPLSQNLDIFYLPSLFHA